MTMLQCTSGPGARSSTQYVFRKSRFLTTNYARNNVIWRFLCGSLVKTCSRPKPVLKLGFLVAPNSRKCVFKVNIYPENCETKLQHPQLALPDRSAR